MKVEQFQSSKIKWARRGKEATVLFWQAVRHISQRGECKADRVADRPVVQSCCRTPNHPWICQEPDSGRTTPHKSNTITYSNHVFFCTKYYKKRASYQRRVHLPRYPPPAELNDFRICHNIPDSVACNYNEFHVGGQIAHTQFWIGYNMKTNKMWIFKI